MHYKVVSEILGFKEITDVTIEEIDEFFSKMTNMNNENISFILVKPHMLREYEFEIPQDVKQSLQIESNDDISVYSIVIIQKPLEQSVVNFLAPIVINEKNKTLAQVVLEPKQHPDFGMAERIEAFKQKSE